MWQIVLANVFIKGRVLDSDVHCFFMALHGASSPELYGLPKIHMKNKPLMPTVSKRCSVTYGVAKELAKIKKKKT